MLKCGQIYSCLGFEFGWWVQLCGCLGPDCNLWYLGLGLGLLVFDKSLVFGLGEVDA